MPLRAPAGVMVHSSCHGRVERNVDSAQKWRTCRAAVACGVDSRASLSRSTALGSLATAFRAEQHCQIGELLPQVASQVVERDKTHQIAAAVDYRHAPRAVRSHALDQRPDVSS